MNYEELVTLHNTARANRDKFQMGVLSLIIGEISVMPRTQVKPVSRMHSKW